MHELLLSIIPTSAPLLASVIWIGGGSVGLLIIILVVVLILRR
jgi:hypothetical protein